jgi:CheY-like chemotaxis protein
VKILIADDNLVFQSVLKAMLTNWGYSVVVACNGEQAWQILRADDGPRLAILDWIMPGMEGIEVCRLARAAFGRDVYILILTSKTQGEDVLAALEAGADDYVTKPFKSQELSARLRIGRRILDLEDHLVVARACTCEHMTHCLFGRRLAAETTVLAPALKVVHRGPHGPYQSQSQARLQQIRRVPAYFSGMGQLRDGSGRGNTPSADATKEDIAGQEYPVYI